MELTVLNTSGKTTTKKVKLSKNIFEIQPNDHAIYLDVKRYLANQHKGTHSTKTRAEVAGSTRKIKKQKGTGTARAGNIRNPIFKGGGRVFGPKPRSYAIKLNQKVVTLARKSALTYKAKDNKILIIEDFDFKAPKTKNYLDILKNLKVADNKTLLVLGDRKGNIHLSTRNISNAQVLIVSELNTYDIMNAQKILFIDKSIEALEKFLLKTDKDKD